MVYRWGACGDVCDVLALDSLDLATQKENITFRFDRGSAESGPGPYEAGVTSASSFQAVGEESKTNRHIVKWTVVGILATVLIGGSSAVGTWYGACRQVSGTATTTLPSTVTSDAISTTTASLTTVATSVVGSSEFMGVYENDSWRFFEGALTISVVSLDTLKEPAQVSLSAYSPGHAVEGFSQLTVGAVREYQGDTAYEIIVEGIDAISATVRVTRR